MNFKIFGGDETGYVPSGCRIELCIAKTVTCLMTKIEIIATTREVQQNFITIQCFYNSMPLYVSNFTESEYLNYIPPYRKKSKFKSAGERKIARFLSEYGIRYEYEHGVFINDDEKTKIWYPDFYLPEYGIYIEYYGLVGHPDYDLGIQKKTKIYEKMGLVVIPIYPQNFDANWQSEIVNQLMAISQDRLSSLVRKRYREIRPF